MRVLHLVLCPLLAASCFPFFASVHRPSDESLSTVLGGDHVCFACYPPAEEGCDAATAEYPPCKLDAGGEFCMSYVYTELKPVACAKVFDGGNGYTGCQITAVQTCVRIRTCTACGPAGFECLNCGEESTEDKGSECTEVPYDFCIGDGA